MKIRHDDLLSWLRTASEEQISATGTTRAYLKQIAYGHKPASPEIAVRIEVATRGVATRKMLRPHDWGVLWPELARLDGFQHTTAATFIVPPERA